MPEFKKSSACGDAHCVEVAELPNGSVVIRHSSDLDGPSLTYTAQEWRDFVNGVKNNEFDVAALHQTR